MTGDATTNGSQGEGGPQPDAARCNAKKKDGTHCRALAGLGTSHLGYGNCKFHLGKTKNNTLHAELLRAQGELPFLGHDLSTHPIEGLKTAIDKTAGQLAYASERVRALDPHDDEATRSAWVRIQQDLIDRLARYSKMGLEMRIDERGVSFAEAYADILAPALKHILEGLDLTDEQRERAPDVIRQALMAAEDRPQRGQVLEPISKDTKRTAAFIGKQERRLA